jgi:hypothetical protein
MYDPEDKYLQKQIKAGVEALRFAVEESTNKAQTKREIIEKLEKFLPIEEKLDVWF